MTETGIQGLLTDDSGQDLIEYALIAMMIALAAVGAFSGLGSIILARFSNISNAF